MGNDWTVPHGVVQNVEAFTCGMYGYNKLTSINLVRLRMLKKMVGVNEQLTLRSKVDLSRLPPSRNCLIPHIQRTNYRLACIKQANHAIHWTPKPYESEQGWKRSDNGLIEPVWSCGAILPPSLVDVLDEVQQINEEEEIINEFEDDDFDDE